MIFYRGLGFLALFFFVATGVLVGYILNWVFGIDLLATKAWWPLHCAFLLGAIVTFALGRYLNRNLDEETIYEKTGPVKVLRPRHTLYFIRMEYWGLIILAIYLIAVAAHQLR
jgi:membrane protein YqaA with SNARE-associated domain